MDTFHKMAFDVEPYLDHLLLLLLEVVVEEEHCNPSSAQDSADTVGTEQSDMNLFHLHQINHESCLRRPSRLRL